jgi:hypothetical protein
MLNSYGKIFLFFGLVLGAQLRAASPSPGMSPTQGLSPSQTFSLTSLPSPQPSSTAALSPLPSAEASPTALPSPPPSPTAGPGASAVLGSCPISTVAGNGQPGTGGDGGPARTAEFNQVGGITFDAFGDLILADTGNNRVRKMDPSGLMSTVAGNGSYGSSGDGGAGTAAQLASPQNVATDAAGDIYIADYGNNRIRKVDLSGTITTVAGNGLGGFSGDGGPATSAQLDYPDGLTVDPPGHFLYIADTGNQRVRCVDLSSGIIFTVAGNGLAAFSGDGGPATAAALNGPSGVAVDGNGNVYVADSFNERIREFSPGGMINTVAGSGATGFNGDGGPALDASFGHPQSPVVDRFGSIFIADLYNNRVRKVDGSGMISTVAGGAYVLGDGGPAQACEFNGPWDLAFDANGDLFISDKYQYRVREVLACVSGGPTCGPCVSTSSAHGAGKPGATVAAALASPLIAAPDPAGSWVTLYWDQASAGSDKISILDVAGEQVWPKAGSDYVTGELASGRQSLRIDLSGLASGVYIARECLQRWGAQPLYTKIAVMK